LILLEPTLKLVTMATSQNVAFPFSVYGAYFKECSGILNMI